MNACISSHRDFLKKILTDLRIIKTASPLEISCLVEILFNIHKIPFNRSERNSIVKFLHIVRYIGKIRDTEKARDFLYTFAKHFLRTVVKAALSSKK